MTDEKTSDKDLVEEQLRIYGLMKFPKDFMNISEQKFSWVYENRPAWVEFSEKWQSATGLFKFWYLYVKLRRSLLKNDQPSDGSNNSDSDEPYYTVPVAE